jgi:hypothetical protein
MRERLLVRSGVAVAILATTFVGMPAATAQTDVPAYGSITISDQGLGPRTTWTYDDLLDCGSTSDGPRGVPQIITVTCYADQSPLSFSCPLMIVTRTTSTVVGARATCGSTLDMGVGTSGVALANLGHVSFAIICEAYVDVGVLVPPYSVTCNEPGLPTGSRLPVNAVL